MLTVHGNPDLKPLKGIDGNYDQMTWCLQSAPMPCL